MPVSMQYFFILGRAAALSRAEIMSVLRRKKIANRTIASANDFLILEIAGGIDAINLSQELAGTIKIGEVADAADKINAEKLIEILPPSDKILFGISAYGLNIDINALGRQIKQLYKNNKIPCRFVSAKSYPLSSVIVQKNLLKKGTEIIILKSGGFIHIGRTSAVQPFELFNKIDYGRPERDAKSGMLPPKLAQIMVNLAELAPEAAILDPFCGSGTILQQASMLGYKNVIAADKSRKAVENTTKNIAWLEKLLNKKISFAVKQQSIENLRNTIKPRSIDAIITEPYLGPALRGDEPLEKISAIAKDLTSFYQRAFKIFNIILKKNGIIIIVIPAIKHAEAASQLIPEKIIPQNYKILGQWQYSRPDQFIIRNICKIKLAG